MTEFICKIIPNDIIAAGIHSHALCWTISKQTRHHYKISRCFIDDMFIVLSFQGCVSQKSVYNTVSAFSFHKMHVKKIVLVLTFC